LQRNPVRFTAHIGGAEMTIYSIVKRTLDYVTSVVAVVCTAPLMLLVALISIAMQGFPVFYTSMRYIAKDKAVRIYKFRSMVTDAKSDKYHLNERFMQDGYLDIPIDCEVYTPFGRILERTEIVELPQIYNVLFNGMSWVGNRALPEENVKLLQMFPGWEERFDSPCGLTGISQVVGKYNLTAKERITLECLFSRVYKQGNVLKADFFIALATARLILLGKNVSYDDAIALLESCL
jgi:lipopolysaccharide/colanic/teichoic acid biosynthesis glycosyltransferase